MSSVGGISGTPSPNSISPATPSGPLTAATALAFLARNKNSTVEISDSVRNILKNLDALQAVAAKVTSVSTEDSSTNMQVTATQYQKDAAILAKWGAGDGQTVSITGAKASISATLPSYVTSISVADTGVSIQSRLSNLQALADSGLLHEVVQTGAPRDLALTTDQLAASTTLLDKFKNHAYRLAITDATVSDVLGLGSDPALTSDSRIRSIAIVDTTEAIGTNLDALQQVGLRIKSITPSDPGTSLTVTGDQYTHDRVALGKIVSSDYLDVIEASAAQARTLAADHKVLTVEIHDTASNIAWNWSLLQTLSDSLTAVEVTDQQNSIRLTASQYATSAALLSKFTDTGDQTYKLAVTNVGAETALAVANSHNVDSVDVVDTSANLASSLDDLQTLNGLGELKSVTLAGTRTPMAMDVSFLQGDELAETQGVLTKIKGGNYTLAVTGASTSALTDLASNKRVVSIEVSDSSDNIQSSLDTLYRLGGRLSSIEQTDSGATFSLTQTQMESRSTVLSKISGGYTVSLTGVTAGKAVSYANNPHVTEISVSDTGRNIQAYWTALRSLGADLTSISKTDNGALTLSVDNYQLGVHDNLVSKFGQSTTFSVFGATAAQAQTLDSDDKVTQIDASDTGSAIIDNLASLTTLAEGGKLKSITNQTPTVSLSLDASKLEDAQTVLAIIKSANYTLSVTGVGAADAKDLVAGNSKIASVAVEGDATSIVANLSDLNGLGRKLATITQTDAPDEALAMTGASFEQNAAALAKIEGGYLAILSQVTAAKAASLASNAKVSSVSVTDTGAHLASAWASLSELGTSLTEVTQSDSSTLQMTLSDWNNGQTLRTKFDSDPTVSISGARVSQVDDLATDTAVEAIQVEDTASALSAAMTDLASQDKITQLVLEDPAVAMTMSATTYAASTAVLGLVKNNQYTVELSGVESDDVATLASDAHVSSMDVSDTSSEVSAHFSAMAAATNLNSIVLSDLNGTITLTSAQILDHSDTLAMIDGSYGLVATGVAMTDLSSIEDVPQISSIRINDTAENVSANFSDILALGDTLGQIHLTDGTPVLSLAETTWTAGSTALATIDGTYHVDVTETVAGDAAAVAANNTVRNVEVADTASNIAGHWDTLVSLYNAGAGKLTALSLTGSNSLTLTSDQQDTGAALIADLLSSETIATA